MSSLSLVFAVCAFASGFGMRIVDPLILPISAQFSVTPATAALLTTAYALPYALAQPFLGPLGDRFGKVRCMQVCVTAMAAIMTSSVSTSGATVVRSLAKDCAASVSKGATFTAATRRMTSCMSFGCLVRRAAIRIWLTVIDVVQRSEVGTPERRLTSSREGTVRRTSASVAVSKR